VFLKSSVISFIYCLLLFFKVGVEESIVNAPPDSNSDQLCKSNLTFYVVKTLSPNLKKHPLHVCFYFILFV
jgi:hypothetical protein